MAASRKPRNADTSLLAPLRGKRLAVGLSGGIDSIVLLHVLRALQPQFGYRLSAVHVNHGLSPNAAGWEGFCVAFCRELAVPLSVKKVQVRKAGKGLEAAARQARREALDNLRVDAVALAHHLDDQAETVLLNLLRGAGVEGASGMAARSRLGRKTLVRPFLGVSRAEIARYAAEHRLGWVEDESNADVALTRNFVRQRVGPLLESRFPRWREALARAARHFSKKNADATRLLRASLASRGLKAPSEAKLAEILKQVAAGKGEIGHDGVVLKIVGRKKTATRKFKPRRWRGEPRLKLPSLGGELRFRTARGRGIDKSRLKGRALEVRLRSGGERLRLHERRPHRTLKNLFQETGIRPEERARLPLLFCGTDLVWVPGLGVAAEYLTGPRASGLVPEWRPSSA